MASTRSYHHGNLRATLLEHAEAALAAGDELSLRELARRSGVSHGAPRRHFADKQALLDALALDGFERLGALLSAALAASATGLRGRMLAFGRTYVEFAMDHAALLELMYAGKHRPGVGDEVVRAGEEAFASSLSLFQEGQASGEIVAGDTERIAAVAFAAFHGLAALANSGMLDSSRIEGTIEEVVDRLVLGLAPR